MEFEDAPRRAPSEPFVPMINVVFLLLIFFLMTAEIAPPEPFESEPPVAEAGADPSGFATIHLSPEGAFAFAGAVGSGAVEAARAAAGDGPLMVKADADAPAAVVAAALARLSAAGIAEVELIVAERGERRSGT
ncbi:MAG: biopolymer transporter ExbD [Pseudomonadota bacterium]